MTDLWTPHKARVAADFGAAAVRYDQSARLQKAVLSLLLERLPDTASTVRRLVDVGSGTGLALSQLSSFFPGAQLLALDLAEGMALHARSRYAGLQRNINWIVGDAEALPMRSASLDLLFSSLAIQWCENVAGLFDELGRVLAPGGRLLVSTLVEGTLDELRQAWQLADPNRPHVNRFLSTAALKDEVWRVFPAAEVEIIPVRLMYPDLLSLLRELKGLGARYKDDGKRSGATAPGRLRRLEEAYNRFASGDAGLPSTYQVAVIQA